MIAKAKFMGTTSTCFPDGDFVAEPNTVYDVDVGIMDNGMYYISVGDITRYYKTASQIEKRWKFERGLIASLE